MDRVDGVLIVVIFICFAGLIFGNFLSIEKLKYKQNQCSTTTTLKYDI